MEGTLTNVNVIGNMENSGDSIDNVDADGGVGGGGDGGDTINDDTTASYCSPTSPSVTSPGYQLFGRQIARYQSMGGGKAAEWRWKHVSFGVIIVATVAWFLFEHSGLPFLTICADVLMILIVLSFLHANYATMRNKQFQPLPELNLTEEMVNDAAASFRGRINNILRLAHDITVGKDFRLFLQAVVCLWLLSTITTLFSFFTLAYIGTILSIAVPALYGRIWKG